MLAQNCGHKLEGLSCPWSRGGLSRWGPRLKPAGQEWWRDIAGANLAWAQPAAAAACRPLVRGVWRGREMVGLQGQRDADVVGPPACWCCTELSAASPCTSFASITHSENWGQVGTFKRLIVIFRGLYGNCGEHIIWGGEGEHKGTTARTKTSEQARPSQGSWPDAHSSLQPTRARSSSHQTSPCSRPWPLIPGTLRTPAQNVLLCGLSYSQNDWQWKYPPHQGKTKSPHKGSL